MDDNPADDDASKARKRKERLEQNRISARESRKRKKTMIEELQRTVITLSRENKDLNERNESLRRQLMEIGAKVCVITSTHRLVTTGHGDMPRHETTVQPPVTSSHLIVSLLSQYPNIVPLQAIVGQGTAMATADGSAPPPPAAPAPAAPVAGALSSLNPMNWISGGAPAPASSSSSPPPTNQANV